ncbi:MAG: DUF4405 domain-containing protein [Bacteroidales bacterium]|nr:DUF4405 domain-containing protein [Bacteroidales bacterium]
MMKWLKNKTKLNLLIDTIMLVLLMAIAGLGVLIKYVLIPGYERNALYQGDVELYFIGHTRHEWGSIHLWLSCVFLFLIILHIILHWKMITCIFKQMITGRTSRAIIVFFTGIVAIFFALAPFFVKPEVIPFQVKYIHKYNIEKPLEEPGLTEKKETPVSNHENQTTERLHKNQEEYSHRHAHDVLEIYGYMTLEEAARKYSIPITELTRAVNIPLSVSSEKIGRLKKTYGFKMEELKDAIIKIQNNNN